MASSLVGWSQVVQYPTGSRDPANALCFGAVMNSRSAWSRPLSLSPGTAAARLAFSVSLSGVAAAACGDAATCGALAAVGTAGGEALGQNCQVAPPTRT